VPPALDLPLDRARPAVQSFRGAHRAHPLPEGLSEELGAAARRHGVTPFMVLLAGLQVLLWRLSGQQDVAIGTPVAGRRRPEVEGLIGFFVNTLVLRGDLRHDPTGAELLARVRDICLEGFAHQDLPFERLVEELRPERDLSRPALFSVLLVEQNAPLDGAAMGDITLAPRDLRTRTAKFDLSLSAWRVASRLHIGFDYATDLFDAATVQRWAAQFARLLAALVADPGRRLTALPVLEAAERHQVAVEWNDTLATLPHELCVHHLVERQARRRPERLALAAGAESLSYGELDRRAERLAGLLRRLGVRPDAIVGLCAERSLEMVVAMLATLKAGGAYLPLDPTHPRRRLEREIAAAGAVCVLTQQRLVERLPSTVRLVVLSPGGFAAVPEEPTAPAASKETTAPTGMPAPATLKAPAEILVSTAAVESTAPTAPSAHPEPPKNAAAWSAGPSSLAYVNYTSGSTGEPKGVGVPHRGVVRLVVEGSGAARFGADEVFLQLAPIAFDLATFEVWGALAHGATLAIMPPGTPTLDGLAAELARQQVTILWLTAGLFHQMVEERLDGLRGVRQLLAGGEVLSPPHMRRAVEALPSCCLINGYGPTENTTFTSCFPVVASRLGRTVPIGRPIGNTRAHVLDAWLQPVPIGVAGELCAGGAGLARGYLGRPDLTAEKFVPDPLGASVGEPGGRLYLTGDLARCLADGTLEFLGRRDAQLKLRGFRIEPAEIEAALSEHPAIAAAAVLLHQDGSGERRLVAYLAATVEEAGVPAAAELRRFLAERLPDPMVPAFYVTLPALPLTANGKVDRQALAKLAPAQPDAAPGRAPATPTERRLAAVWCDVLRLPATPATPETPATSETPETPATPDTPAITAEADFFALGGHSLLGTRLLSRVRDEFHVELQLRALFEHPTIAALAAEIDRTLPAERAAPARPALRSGQSAEPAALSRRDTASLPVCSPPAPEVSAPAPAILPVIAALPRSGGIAREAPVSFAQERLWLLDQLLPGTAVYSVPLRLDLRGALDRAALAAALGEIVRRHEALRTTFAAARFSQPPEPRDRPRRSIPLQIIAPPKPVAAPLPVVDLAALAAPRRDAEAQRLGSADAGRPFDLARGPLLRATLLHLGGSEHAALFNLHHIVCDGWSMGVFLDELTALYAAGAARRPSALAALPVQYADYAVWQRSWLSGDVLDAQLRHWRERLAGAPPALDLPLDRPRPVVQSFRGGRAERLLPASMTAELDAAARRHGVTPFMVLLAGVQGLLGRLSGQEDVAVGTPVAGRRRPEIEGLIGFFVNTLVLRGDLRGDPTAGEVLARVRDTCLEAYSHQDLPFERLVEELRPERDTSRSALFSVLLLEQNAPLGERGMGELTLASRELQTGTAKFDLSLAACRVGPRLSLVASYATDLFDAPTIDRLLGHLAAVLAAAPQVPLSQLALLGAPERHQVLCEWNDTAREVPRDVCLHRLFEAQAARSPAAVALAAGGERLTYAELNGRANRLARWLAARGVAVETPVGVCLERNADLVIALLAIIKAGGAYVPLDPAYPQARLAQVVEGSLAGVERSAVLVHRSLLARLPGGTPRLVCLEDERDAIARHDDLDLPDRAAAENLAYVLYTSGSTGRPKGVQIPHRALVNFLLSMHERPGLRQGGRLLAATSLAFDIAGLEIYLPLLAGGEVRLAAAEEAADGARLLAALAGGEVDAFQATPSTWRLLAEAGWREGGHLTALSGGEALGSALAQRLTAGCAAAWNLYGPTETTIWSAVARLSGDETGWAPLGRPIANTGIFLLQADLQPAPIGVVGELFIGGDGLARGYCNAPDLTAASFLPHPASARPGARLYRTGDLARFRASGEIEFAGRRDQQVKVRGFRVELAEVESAMAAHPGVQEAVAVVRRPAADAGGSGGAGDPRLVAYLVARGAAPTTEELRSHLGDRLPAYMVPSIFVVMAALPLSPNGKVDRKALPEPEGSRPQLGKAFVPPGSDLELRLAEIWQSVLGLDQVGIEDSFFELGGDSIGVTQVVARAGSAGIQLTAHQIFRHPTISALAAAAGAAAAAGPAGRAAAAAPPPGPHDAPVASPPDLAGEALSEDELATIFGQIAQTRSS
jgi:amino acid adenylation domain-containing protein